MPRCIDRRCIETGRGRRDTGSAVCTGTAVLSDRQLVRAGDYGGMSSDYEEQIGSRHRLTRYGQQYYLYISGQDLMFSAPGEGDIKNAEVYSMVNAICRLVSVSRKHGVKWSRIVKQLRGANVTQARTWTADIARIIEDDRGLVDDRNG